MRLVALFLFFAVRVLPCSCGGTTTSYCAVPPTPDPNSALFLGTVEPVESPGKPQTGSALEHAGSPLYQPIVKFRVDESFVGAQEPFFYLDRSGSAGVCVPKFEPGQEYLVSAVKSKGRWTTSVCFGTTLSRNRRYDLDALRAWKRGIRPPLVIHGWVQSSPASGDQAKVARSFRVQLHGVGVDLQTTTDSEGYFAFRDLVPGFYRLLAHPLDQPLSGDGKRIDLTKHLCGSEPITIRPPLGQISGRLPGAVEGLLVRARSEKATRVAWTKASGEFHIEDLWPGEYTLTVETEKRPTVFYPGVREKSSARILQIEFGAVIRLPDWSLGRFLGDSDVRRLGNRRD